jgi:hypothetical protein
MKITTFYILFWVFILWEMGLGETWLCQRICLFVSLWVMLGMPGET